MAKDTVKVDGVEAPYDKEKLGDMRFVLMLGDFNDDTLDESAKLSAMAQIMRFLFGSERYRVLDDLADANGGNVDMQLFSVWLAAYFEAVGAKN